MTYLLDVNILIAVLWITHTHHAKADAWIKGKRLALCPISEMGFLRISSHPRGLGARMADAEALLEKFYGELHPEFIAADISCRALRARNSDAVSDIYLARLADRHKMKLATLDTSISHHAVEIIQ